MPPPSFASPALPPRPGPPRGPRPRWRPVVAAVAAAWLVIALASCARLPTREALQSALQAAQATDRAHTAPPPAANGSPMPASAPDTAPTSAPGSAPAADAAAAATRRDASPPPRTAASSSRPPPPLTHPITIRDHRGVLPPQAEAQAIAAVKAEGAGGLVEHHLRVLAASGEVDLYRGNAARLLIDGPATFGAMKAAIEKARARVLLESYIVEDGGVADDFARLLAAKVADGVAVLLLYDAIGSIGTDAAWFERLAAAGVRVCKFNPVNPVERPGYWSINHRDHRKVLVVDQAVSFTGGINISRVYSSGSAARGRGGSSGFGSGGGGAKVGAKDGAKDDEAVLADGWRDTHIELRGPVVPAFAAGFERIWRSQGCPGAVPPAPPPPQPIAGQRIVKLIESDPVPAPPRDDPGGDRVGGAGGAGEAKAATGGASADTDGVAGNRIYAALLAAIDASRRSVHLTMAYFAPGADMVRALADAARRGVEVVLVLPGRSDFSLVLHAGRSYYEELLAAGVRIHEMDDAMMHAKTAVIDGVFGTVGSSNMDWRSWVDNNEVNVIVLGEDFSNELEAQFERDVAASRPITPAEWRRRGIAQRLKELVGRLTERLL